MDHNKPARKNTNDPKFKHLDLGTANAASSMDFTGLIPANPQTQDEQDAYESMYDFGNEIPEEIADEMEE